jgi:hypothetical protein
MKGRPRERGGLDVAGSILHGLDLSAIREKNVLR